MRKYVPLVLFALSLFVGIIWLRFLAINSPLPGEQFPVTATGTRLPEGHAFMGADYSDNRQLVGESHNVFVAKIIQAIGHEPRSGDPATRWQAEVIYNIKGNLEGTVIFDEFNNAHGLQPGTTYLLALRGDPRLGYALNTDPRLSKAISSDSTLTNNQLRDLAAKDARVQELLVAYTNEILDQGEVRASDTPNSFQSLSQEEKNAVLSKIKN